MILDVFEQKGLFRFIRFLSLATILFLFGLVGFCVTAYLAVKDKRPVSIEEVNAQTYKMHSEWIDEDGTIRIPPDIFKKYFKDEKNNKVVSGWISTLNMEEKDEFVSNLVALINEAELKGKPFSAEQINAYKEVKFKKFNSATWDKYEQKFQKGAIIFFIAVLLGMIGLFSLTLVLLAIERNTRPV